MESISVNIFGKNVRLRGEDPDAIREIAAYLNTKLDEISDKLEFTDSSQIIILGAMIITEELFKLKSVNSNLLDRIKELENRIGLFLHDIDCK